MNQSFSNQQTGRIGPADDQPEPHSGSGPLQRRIQAGPQAFERPIALDREASGVAIQFATVALLDGTVVGRLECDASLGQIVVGRGSLADIQVHDSFVHRAHSEIHWDTDVRAHVISHAGGSNPTFVNLQRVDKPTRLIDGARIRIGKTELIYRRVFYAGG
jgi:hypothetical protein